MAKIESGDSAEMLVVDSSSKAARVAVVNNLGENVNAVRNEYIMAIPIGRITAAIAANSYLFALRNGITRRIKVKKAEFMTAFDGIATATTQQFDLVRFTAGAPAGGTALSVPSQIPRRSTLHAQSALSDVRFSGAVALTVTGVTFEAGVLLTFGISRSATGQTEHFNHSDDLDVWLEPGEGLALRATAATVIGDSVQGLLSWSEE